MNKGRNFAWKGELQLLIIYVEHFILWQRWQVFFLPFFESFAVIIIATGHMWLLLSMEMLSKLRCATSVKYRISRLRMKKRM